MLPALVTANLTGPAVMAGSDSVIFHSESRTSTERVMGTGRAAQPIRAAATSRTAAAARPAACLNFRLITAPVHKVGRMNLPRAKTTGALPLFPGIFHGLSESLCRRQGL